MLPPIISRKLEQGLFAALSLQRKIALLDLLIEFGAQSTNSVSLHNRFLVHADRFCTVHELQTTLGQPYWRGVTHNTHSRFSSTAPYSQYSTCA